MSGPAATPVSPPVSRFGRVLNVVRKLIDYGKDLATALQRRAATTHLATVTFSFGTSDIGLILARITRGLLLANALEARVVALAAQPVAPPRPARAPAQRAPRAPKPASARPTREADPRLALLPTAEQIAAEIRRRPIGAVIADICRDLGIIPTHPLWQELSLAVIWHGGSFNRLFKDVWDRVLPSTAQGRSVAAPAALPAPAATGPP
jgi:hypothetical protein